MVLGIKSKKKKKRKSTDYFRSAKGAVTTALGLVLIGSALGHLSK